MRRVPEPELMNATDQAEAYARADFEDAHRGMIRLFGEVFVGETVEGFALDLGCGPGDIACRFARAYPDLQVHGIDASEAMLEASTIVMARYPEVGDRVHLIHGLLPDCQFPRESYNVVVSNSLLHHLTDPHVLWRSIERASGPDALVFVMDLRRPDHEDELDCLVDVYATNEPDVLRRDFANSLHAAYRKEEIEEQLHRSPLAGLSVREVTDRHLIVFGRYSM